MKTCNYFLLFICSLFCYLIGAESKPVSILNPNAPSLLEESQKLVQGLNNLSQSASFSENDSIPSYSNQNLRKYAPEWEGLDTYSLELLAKLYRHNMDYPSEVRILSLLILKHSRKPEYRLKRIQAEKQIEYLTNPSRSNKDKFIKKLEDLLKKYPKNKDIYWEIFNIYHHFNEWVKGTDFTLKQDLIASLELLKNIRSKFGESPQISSLQCQYFYLNSFFEEAREICSSAKKEDPKNISNFIYSEYFLDDKNEKSLLKILKKFPNSKEVLTLVGQVFLSKKKLNVSINYFNKALKIESQYFPALIGKAAVLFQDKKEREALIYYTKACQINKYKTRKIFEQAKASLSRENKFKEAAKYSNSIVSCINS